MARQTILVKTNPKVVKWIIDDSGLDVAELAEKIKVTESDVEKWMTSSVEIEMKKLEKISRVLKRPLATFFLPEPPEESRIPDYRRLPGQKEIRLSLDTRAKIRDVRHLQEIAEDLMKAQGMDTEPMVAAVTTQSSPERIAETECKKLGLESGALSVPEAKTPRELYSALRQTIESLNIFVFQTSMQIEEVRAITLSDRLPMAIVVSSKDIVEARIFSLLHEYGHILLRKDGMCIPQTMYESGSYDDLQHIEAWCNSFAASVLMPEKPLLKECRMLEERGFEKEEIIYRLAAKFRVSKQAVAVRLRNLGKDDPASGYDLLLQKIKSSETRRSAKNTGGVERTRLCISNRGRKFVSLVLESEVRDIIHISDVAEYLGIKLKHLKKLEEQAL